MLNYVLYKNKNKYNAAYGKYYARLLSEAMSFEEFITHMATHHCVFSEATIRGVLIEMETCLREMLLEGKAVRFDELGIFSLGIKNATGGAETAYDFNVGKHINKLHLNLFLGRRFRAKQLKADAKFQEARMYDVDSSKPADTNQENATGGGGTGGTGMG